MERIRKNDADSVLAKNFMYGKPAVVLRANLNEFMEDGQEVAALDDNTSYGNIESAVDGVVTNFNHYSISCRKKFEETFCYRKYN